MLFNQLNPRGITNRAPLIGSPEQGSRFLVGGTRGQGDGGNIQLQTRSLTLLYTGRLSIRGRAFAIATAYEGSTGQGGDLTVNASDSVEVVGASLDDQFNSFVSTVLPIPQRLRPLLLWKQKDG